MRVHERSHRILCKFRNEHPQHGDRYNDGKLSTPETNLNAERAKCQCPSADLDL